MPATPLLEGQVARALQRAGYSKNNTSLVVAVSGGPDSVALLRSLHRLSSQHQVHLHVAHLNHDFRGEEADADAEFVETLAHVLALPVTVEKQDPIEYARVLGISSFEQAARNMRYTFLAEVARKIGASAAVVGHTADDLAETVLMHILRGSGLHGLRGMAELSRWPTAGNDLSLFRPLLESTKEGTVAYCEWLGQRFREDSGNSLPRFKRNQVRHELLPLLASNYNPQIRNSLIRMARSAAVQVDYLEKEVDRAWAELANEQDGSVSLALPGLASLHPALRVLVLRRAYSVVTGDLRRLRERHLVAMTEMLAGKSAGGTLELPWGVRFYVSYDWVRLDMSPGLSGLAPDLPREYSIQLPSGREESTETVAGGWRITLRWTGLPDVESLQDNSNETAIQERTEVSTSGPGERPDGNLRVGTGHALAWLDRASLGEQVQVRTRQSGDRFQPLGMQQEKKLQDFFTDAKVPREWRDRVPLLVADRGIAWVVGYRIAHWARVTPMEGASGGVLRVEFESNL
jgi:tRNA(Ile)-lysidine synthase